MAHGHLLGYPVAVIAGSMTAFVSGTSAAVLAMESETAAAWTAILVASGGFVTALAGLAVPIFRLWVDSLHLKEQLDEARGSIVELRDKASRDRATIRRNFSLIKGLMERMSQSTVMEIVRIQDEKEAAERAQGPGKSLIIPPFDMRKPEGETPSGDDPGVPDAQH